jgi:RNA methyltransferase, TrmH family
VILQVSGITNQRLKIAAALSSPSRCRRHGLFQVEGPRFISDLIDRNCPVEFLVLSSEATRAAGDCALMASDKGLTVLKTPSALFRRVSDTVHSQGILAVCPTPSHTIHSVFSGGNVLVLDGVSDPGNAGTAIRSAAAFGCSGTVFLKGSVFPWSPKVTRASAGLNTAHPIAEASTTGEITSVAIKRSYTLAGARSGGVDIREARLSPPVCLFIGAEAAGLSDETRNSVQQTVSIAMAPGVESLNAGVSASIMLHWLSVAEILQKN